MSMHVLLLAYGTPENLSDVGAYYTHIRKGRTPSPEKIAELCRKYELIGASPLTKITTSQAEKLQQRLNRDGIDARVVVGMKHWHPFIEEAVKELSRIGASEASTLVLAPHYSKLSVGQYHDYIEEARSKYAPPINFQHVKSWALEPHYLKALELNIASSLGEWNPTNTMVLFTAHSLPERIRNWKDPYEQELLETSEALARGLSLPHWKFVYQSASNTGEPWLGPDILEELEQISLEKLFGQILVCPIGFVTDHLEVLYDIDIEAKAFATERGLDLKRTPSLNDSELLIEAIYSALLKLKA